MAKGIDPVFLDYEHDESAGTRRFFNLIGPWLDILENRYTVSVDEIETSLHPILIKELLKLLLHGEFTTRPFPDCADVVRQLKKSIIRYSKGQTLPGDFIEKTPTAVIYSERCREHHRTSGGDGNPATKMDLLIRVLNNATRPHHQFQLDSR